MGWVKPLVSLVRLGNTAPGSSRWWDERTRPPPSVCCQGGEKGRTKITQKWCLEKEMLSLGSGAWGVESSAPPQNGKGCNQQVLEIPGHVPGPVMLCLGVCSGLLLQSEKLPIFFFPLKTSNFFFFNSSCKNHLLYFRICGPFSVLKHRHFTPSNHLQLYFQDYEQVTVVLGFILTAIFFF